MNLKAFWFSSDSIAKEWLKWCATDTKLASSEFLNN